MTSQNVEIVRDGHKVGRWNLILLCPYCVTTSLNIARLIGLKKYCYFLLDILNESKDTLSVISEDLRQLIDVWDLRSGRFSTYISQTESDFLRNTLELLHTHLDEKYRIGLFCLCKRNKNIECSSNKSSI